MSKKRYEIYAISYGDKSFSMSMTLNLWTAKWIGGIKNTIAYTPFSMDEQFINKNKQILQQKRGGGYWLWKPYIILDALSKIDEGDYLIYTDAGMIYVRNIHHLIRQLERDGGEIFLSLGFAPAKDWCKRDAFILMGCDNKEASEKIMVSGGYILLRKSEKSVRFIQEWLKYSEDERILTDCPNRCGYENYAGFKEHRHDQAILTNLTTIYNIEGYKAVTHVDEPRAHLAALKKGILGAYQYTFAERIELMKHEHTLPGYKSAQYPRMFINTRIRNCNKFLFMMKLFSRIAKTLYIDVWGIINDRKYLG